MCRTNRFLIISRRVLCCLDARARPQPARNACLSYAMAPELAGLDAAGRRALVAALLEDDPFTPAPPAAAEAEWSEHRIRAYFEAGGVDAGEPAATPEEPAFPAPLTREQARLRRCLFVRCTVRALFTPARRATPPRCLPSILSRLRTRLAAGFRASKGARTRVSCLRCRN